MSAVTALQDLPAPAKLNLFLHVTGRRDDGYHLLQTVFRFIDLQDTIHLTRRDDGQILRMTPIPGVPPEQDLMVRAARWLQAHSGSRWGVEIRIDKHIPMGGGLGGGSSNAATVLLGLNRLWALDLPREALAEGGRQLGADVPVFIMGHNAFAEGVGEQLQPIVLPERWYVVIQPDASVPTAEIFQAPELTRDTKPIKMAVFPGCKDFLNLDALGSTVEREAFRNDLESCAFGRYPVLALTASLVEQAIGSLPVEQGAGKKQVRMSGSGACLFVEYNTREAALLASERIDATMLKCADKLPALRLNTVSAGLSKHPLAAY